MNKHYFLLIAFSLLAGSLLAQDNNMTIELILHNGQFLTMDESQKQAEAIAIENGRIYQVGSNADILALKSDDTKLIDLEGKFAMPGFIEGHGHFVASGKNRLAVDLSGIDHWEEAIEEIATKSKEVKAGFWIEGRGWHQEKWSKPPTNEVEGYPRHQSLSAVSSDHPVILYHASFHSLIANEVAMKLANITKETPDPEGGKIVRDSEGNAIGVFEEKAMLLIQAAYDHFQEEQGPAYEEEIVNKSIALATQECWEKGITTFHDLKVFGSEIKLFKKLAAEGKLGVRICAMVYGDSFEEVKELTTEFPMKHIGDHYFSAQGIKAFYDGALGSRGAYLLEDYDDLPGHVGQNTIDPAEFEQIARLAKEKGLQVCTHAIGDRANREVLDIYEKVLAGNDSLRWRVEHAQHLHSDDITRFAKLGVIASIQSIHCTSDAPYVEERLGVHRAEEGAYVWRKLLDANTHIANGTDTPIEDMSPINCIYAGISRQPKTGEPFYPAQKLTRMEALRSYTMDNAYAGFEEDIKGSLSKGKLADIIVLDKDLMRVSDEELAKTQVLMTIIGGKVVFER